MTWSPGAPPSTSSRISASSGRRDCFVVGAPIRCYHPSPISGPAFLFIGGFLSFGNIRIITSSGNAGKDTFTAMRRPDDFERDVLEQKAGSDSIASMSTTPSVDPAPDGALDSRSTSTGLQAVKLVTRLATLRDAGAITPDEYESKKVELLRRI